jgi:hypothetical protein
LQKVLDEDLPVNHAILGNLQDVFNLLPNLSTPKPTAVGGATNGVGPAAGTSGALDNSELARAMSVKTNDQLMAIYLSSLIRAITAFHDLIENKIQNKQQAEDKESRARRVIRRRRRMAWLEKQKRTIRRRARMERRRRVEDASSRREIGGRKTSQAGTPASVVYYTPPLVPSRKEGISRLAIWQKGLIEPK